MNPGAHRSRLVLYVAGARWVKDADLPIAPFPGLGLRVDTYDVLNVAAVSVDASTGDVECAVAEDEPAAGLTEKQCLLFGFRLDADEAEEAEEAEAGTAASTPRAPDLDRQAVPAALVVVDAELGTWHKPLTLPFPPFAGLRLRLGSGSEVSVFSVVLGDSHGPVTCLAVFDEARRPHSESDCEALGFEESSYP